MSSNTSRHRLGRSFEEVLTGTYTADGYYLEGLHLQAHNADKCVVWVHGIYAAFYAPPGLEVGRALAREGVSCILGNNRGHNVGAWIRNRDGQVVLAGGAWERLRDARHDIAAWIDFAEKLGGMILLAGHSLGARKAASYLAQTNDTRVAGLILASPSARPPAATDPTRDTAQEMVLGGRGEELLPLGPHFAVSALTYLERTDPALLIDNAFIATSGESALGRVKVPLLALLGENERSSKDDAVLDLNVIAAAAHQSPHTTTAVVEGANHIYSGAEIAAAGAIIDWADGLPNNSPTVDQTPEAL